jgi:hypothetical protein
MFKLTVKTIDQLNALYDEARDRFEVSDGLLVIIGELNEIHGDICDGSRIDCQRCCELDELEDEIAEDDEIYDSLCECDQKADEELSTGKCWFCQECAEIDSAIDRDIDDYLRHPRSFEVLKYCCSDCADRVSLLRMKAKEREARGL